MFFYVQNIENNNIDNDIAPMDKNKCAILLVSKGEPVVYDNKIILKNVFIKESFVEKLLAPISVFKTKLAYEDLGKSEYIDSIDKLKKLLEEHLLEDYHIYSSYIDIYPYFDSQMEFISKSYKKIIVVPLYLSDVEDTRYIEEYIKNMNSNSNLSIQSTPLLWQSSKLSKQIANDTLKTMSYTDKRLTGVILLDNVKKSNKVQTNTFMNKIVHHMEQDGFNPEKIVYLQSVEEEDIVNKAINKLQESSVNHVIIVNISEFVTNITDYNELNKIIRDLSIKEQIEIDYIDGWGTGENLLNEIEYKVRLLNLKN